MFETPIQIRFADVDMLEHVNNVNMQHYFDVGKTDFFMKVMGIGMDWRKIGLVQKAIQTQYEAQTWFPEPVSVFTRIERFGNKSVTMFQEIRNRETGELKAFCTSTLVAFDFEKQESVPVPEEWKKTV